jgi:hypothetical protein
VLISVPAVVAGGVHVVLRLDFTSSRDSFSEKLLVGLDPVREAVN